MKKIIVGSLLGLALLAFTGCTDEKDATVSKCQAGKCDSAKAKSHKCQSGDAGSKCGAEKKVAKKCGS